MKESIYTIPINQAFEQSDSCPFCLLVDKLEQAAVDYTLGGAMMQPDIRLETNRLGFCPRHLDMLLAMQNRLALGLVLQTHMEQLRLDLAEKSLQKAGETAVERHKSCFICKRNREHMEKYYQNAVYMWKTEPDFREKLGDITHLCFSHHASLLKAAAKILSKKEGKAFLEQINQIMQNRLNPLCENIHSFCKSFDYNSTGQPVDKQIIEKIIEFLG